MKHFKITPSITERSALMDCYFRSVSQERLLTVEEEVSLAKRARMGDKDASDRLVRANLRFVVSVAKRYQNQGVSLPDLISEGNIGLCKAVRLYDESRGFRFCTYAVWWIRQSILAAIASQSRNVRLPANRVSLICRASRTASALEQQYMRPPTEEEIADKMNVDEDELHKVLTAASYETSIDLPQSDDGVSSVADFLIDEGMPKPDAALQRESLHLDVQYALSTLTGQERQIIAYYYGIGESHAMSYAEIAICLGLSKERVRQIHHKGIRHIQQGPAFQLLEQHMD